MKNVLEINQKTSCHVIVIIKYANPSFSKLSKIHNLGMRIGTPNKYKMRNIVETILDIVLILCSCFNFSSLHENYYKKIQT